MEPRIIGRNEDVVQVAIPVSKEDSEKAKNEAFRKYRTRFPVQGFRPKKTPRRMVEMYYGKDIFDPYAANIIMTSAKDYEDYLYEAINGVKIPITGMVGRWNTAHNDEGTFDLIFDFQVLPEPVFAGKSEIEPGELDLEVSEKEIEMELVRQVEQFTEESSTESPAEEGMRVEFDITTYVVEDSVSSFVDLEEGYSLIIGDSEDPEAEEVPEELLPKLEGVRKGERIVFEGVDEDGDKYIGVATVNDVLERANRKIDDDFARDMSIYDTLEEYKVFLRGILLKDKAKARIIEFENEVLEDFLERTEFELPADFKAKQRRQFEAMAREAGRDQLERLYESEADEEKDLFDLYLRLRRRVEILRVALEKGLITPGPDTRDLLEQLEEQYFVLMLMEAFEGAEEGDQLLEFLLAYYGTLMQEAGNDIPGRILDHEKLEPFYEVLMSDAKTESQAEEGSSGQEEAGEDA